MKKAIWITSIVLGSVLVLFLALIFAVRWAFFDIQRIEGQNELTVSQSPNGKYTVTAYLNDGGATTDFAVLCTVKDNENGKEKNIYWNYHCNSADIKWVDEDTVDINGEVLDVETDTYDFRLD